MQISENLSAPTKPKSGRPANTPALYQIKSARAKLLVSFRCRVKIREGEVENVCMYTDTVTSQTECRTVYYNMNHLGCCIIRNQSLVHIIHVHHYSREFILTRES